MITSPMLSPVPDGQCLQVQQTDLLPGINPLAPVSPTAYTGHRKVILLIADAMKICGADL